MSNRPFCRVKGTSKQLDEAAIAKNRRPFVFNFATPDGGEVQMEGAVSVEAAEEFVEIFRRLTALGRV